MYHKTWSLRSACIIWTTWNYFTLSAFINESDTQRNLLGDFEGKLLLKCCFIDSTGTYCFKGAFVNPVFLVTSSPCQIFSFLNSLLHHRLSHCAFRVLLKVYISLHLETFPFSHCGKHSTGVTTQRLLLLHQYVYSKERGRNSTCCCSRGSPQSLQGIWTYAMLSHISWHGHISPFP